MTFIEMFFIFGLALWRLVNLVANEVGPFSIFEDMRSRIHKLEDRFQFLQRFRLFEGYTCEWCLSFWIGAPLLMLWYWIGDVFIYVLVIPAASTFVIVIKCALQVLQQMEAYLVNKNKEK